MRAIRVHDFGPPENMLLEEAADPAPGAGQVLIRVKAAGVNPVEAYIRSGSYYKRALPYTPGTDAAGVVEAVGEGVSAFKPGDRVYTAGTVTGAYAELCLCGEKQVHSLPGNLSYAQGASIGIPYATAYRALFHKAKASAGEMVLVHGATGGVGIAAVQLAKAWGLKVFGTGGTDEGRELAAFEGAFHVLDHNDPAHLEKAKELSNGGLDIIIEFLANVNLGADLAALGKRGRVVVVGSRGSVQIDPRELMSRDASIVGMSLFNATEEELRSIHHGLQAGFESGVLRPRIGREMALGDAPKAHHAIMEERAHGKIVLVP